MAADVNQKSGQLWVNFARLTQQMIELAIDEQWETVANLELQRQSLQAQINTLPETSNPVSTQLAELIRVCHQKNSELVELARAVKTQCTDEASKIAAGKKVAATYSSL